MKKQCEKWFPEHEWTKWEIKDERSIIDTQTRGNVGRIIIQKRTCILCGLYEEKVIKYLLN